jgi:hypothetical protein
MDAKERWLIEQLHSAILSGSFAERDVLALLITLRNHSEQGNLVREFGDFVAHRQKDRGVLQKHLQSVQSALGAELATNGEGTSFTIHSFQSVRNSFNEVFRSLELPELDAELANQITVCIISLLQSVEIKAGSPTCVPKLLVGISREYIALLGQARLAAGPIMNFPILMARNSYMELPPSCTEFMILDRVVEACSINGHFAFAQRAPAA